MGKGYNHYNWCPCEWCRKSRQKNAIYNDKNCADLVLKTFPIDKFSYTVPNAICPVCKCKVFFYQNAYGSRVFFDSLGKPWPKHPCTDNEKYSTKKGKVPNAYIESQFFIPKVSKEKIAVLNSELKISMHSNDFEILNGSYGKDLLIMSGIKYLITEDFENKPDIIIITERNQNFFIETYEILSEFSQQIPLKRKDKNDFENLKHFGLEENEVLHVSITHAVFNSKNLFEVKIEHYEKIMKMKLTNFLEKNQNDVKFLKYSMNSSQNKFKVVYKNNNLFEIE